MKGINEGEYASVSGNGEPSKRDRGMTALFEGFFAFVWFGWGHAAAPSMLHVWLYLGGAAALLVAIAGAVVGFSSPASMATLSDPRAARRYGIIVGVEFGVIGIGSGILGAMQKSDFIPVWACAVAAVHFFPLSSILRSMLLVPLAVLMCVVAVAALLSSLATHVAASTVTGIGVGCLLLLFATIALVQGLTTASSEAPVQTRPGSPMNP